MTPSTVELLLQLASDLSYTSYEDIAWAAGLTPSELRSALAGDLPTAGGWAREFCRRDARARAEVQALAMAAADEKRAANVMGDHAAARVSAKGGHLLQLVVADLAESDAELEAALRAEPLDPRLARVLEATGWRRG